MSRNKNKKLKILLWKKIIQISNKDRTIYQYIITQAQIADCDLP